MPNLGKFGTRCGTPGAVSTPNMSDTAFRKSASDSAKRRTAGLDTVKAKALDTHGVNFGGPEHGEEVCRTERVGFSFRATEVCHTQRRRVSQRVVDVNPSTRRETHPWQTLAL